MKKSAIKYRYEKVGKCAGFAIIAPHTLRKLAIQYSTIHMMLAQVEDVNYWEDYASAQGYKILDNGFYELKHSLPKEILLDKAFQGNANCIVLEDGEHKDMDFFMQKGYDVMLVPKTINQLIEFLHIAHSYEKFRVKVGLSHIHAAKSLNRQRFFLTNRYKFLGIGINEYGKKFGKEARQLLFERTLGGYTIHLLGLGHYPLPELYMISELCKFTCDSNAFIWPWYRKHYPFGRLTRKITEPLDFDYIDDQISKYAVIEQLDVVKKIMDFLSS